MQFLIFLAILAAVVVFVTRPFLQPAGRRSAAPSATELADLEAAREAKYREIRDAELDHQTGKLSPEDFEAIDRSLRAEAVAILHELDAARSAAGPLGAPGANGGDQRLPSGPT